VWSANLMFRWSRTVMVGNNDICKQNAVGKNLDGVVALIFCKWPDATSSEGRIVVWSG
jgi:hypothetical protein